MIKRTLVTLSLLALIVPTGCKSSETESTAKGSEMTAQATTQTASDNSAQPASTSAHAKPKVEKMKGQDVDGKTFKMAVPTGWTKGDITDKSGKFTGQLAYLSPGNDKADTFTGGYAEVWKGTFPYESPEADKKAVWEAVQASVKSDWDTTATFGADYETKDGFTYSSPYNGKKMESYVYFERKGDDVYFVDAGGDLSKITEKDAWSIIESFELK